VDRDEGKESKRPSTRDVITQEEMASLLIFQNVEYPSRASLLQRFHDGAQIEPGPLTIVQPYVDLGPFIIPSTESTRRAEQIRQCLRDARLALAEMDQQSSANEFSRAAQQVTARVWEAVLERRNASLQARNWSGFGARVRDNIYACQVTWMLWAAAKCVNYGLRQLGEQSLGIASARAAELASI
jgi:hypothetical protein